MTTGLPGPVTPNLRSRGCQTAPRSCQDLPGQGRGRQPGHVVHESSCCTRPARWAVRPREVRLRGLAELLVALDQPAPHRATDARELDRDRPARITQHQRQSAVRRHREAGVEGDATEHAHTRLLESPGCPVQVDVLATVRARQRRHVLDHADHRHPVLAQVGQGALGVHLRQVLGGGDEHRARQRQLADHDLDLFARAGRGIHDDDVGLPGDVEDQVAQQARDQPAPGGGQRHPFRDDEPDGHDLQAPALVGTAALARRPDGRQSPAAARPIPRRVDAEQVRDVRPVQVAVEDADPEAHRGQRERQVDGHRRFAHAALAAEHGYHVAAGAQPIPAAVHATAAAKFHLALGERRPQVGVQVRQGLPPDGSFRQVDSHPAVLDRHTRDLRVRHQRRAIRLAQGRDQRSNRRLFHQAAMIVSGPPGCLQHQPRAASRRTNTSTGWAACREPRAVRRCTRAMSMLGHRLRPVGLALLLVVLSAVSPLAPGVMQRLRAQPDTPAPAVPDRLLLAQWPGPSRSPRQFLTQRRLAVLEPTSLTPRPLLDGAQQPVVSPDGRELYFVRNQEMGDAVRVDLVALASDSLASRWTAHVATLSAAALEQPHGASLSNLAIAATDDRVYVGWLAGLAAPLEIVVLDRVDGAERARWQVDLGRSIASANLFAEADAGYLDVLAVDSGAFGPTSGPPLMMVRLRLADGGGVARFRPQQAADAGAFVWNGIPVPGGRALYKLSPDEDPNTTSVEFLDLATGSVERLDVGLAIPREVQFAPREWGASPDGARLYVLSPLSGELAIIDLVQRRVLQKVSLGIPAPPGGAGPPL